VANKTAVGEVAGPGSSAVFGGINIETAVLESLAAAVPARHGRVVFDRRPHVAPTGVAIVDTLLGRVLISNLAGSDEPQTTMLFPGTEQRITRAIGELLNGLPAGPDRATHERIRRSHTR
jgi:hypothetical protein